MATTMKGDIYQGKRQTFLRWRPTAKNRRIIFNVSMPGSSGITTSLSAKQVEDLIDKLGHWLAYDHDGIQAEVR